MHGGYSIEGPAGGDVIERRRAGGRRSSLLAAARLDGRRALGAQRAVARRPGRGADAQERLERHVELVRAAAAVDDGGRDDDLGAGATHDGRALGDRAAARADVVGDGDAFTGREREATSEPERAGVV